MPKARYAALVDDLEHTRQGLAAERAAAAAETDRCARRHADDEESMAACETSSTKLSQELARQADAARTHEREAHDLAADLEAERQRLAQLVKDRSQMRTSIEEMRRALAANANEVGRARNRRIEIVVVPDLTGLPGYDELLRLSAGG